MVGGLAANLEFSGEGGFRFASNGAANECSRLLGVQRLASDFVDLVLLGKSDALTLSLSDEGSFELGNAPMTDNRNVAIAVLVLAMQGWEAVLPSAG